MFMGCEAVAFNDAAGVGINHEDGMFAGIEKDRVSGFGADAVDRKKLFAERGSGHSKHACERAAMDRKKKVSESFEFLCLLAKVAGGANQLCESHERNSLYCEGRQQASRAQIFDGRLNIPPGSALRKDCADDYFESRAARPPMLWSVRIK